MSILLGGIAMNCHKVQSLISAYVDCELPGMEMLSIRQHLNECQDCNLEFESILGLKRMLGSLQAKHPSDVLAARICNQLDWTPIPTHQQILASLKDRFTFVPAKFRLATAGIGIIAFMLVLRTGNIEKTTYQVASGPSASSFSATVNSGDSNYIPIPHMIGGDSYASGAAPGSGERTWEAPPEPEGPSPLSGRVNMLLTSY